MVPPKNKKNLQLSETKEDAAEEEKSLPALKRQKVSELGTKKKDDGFDVHYWKDPVTPAGQPIDSSYSASLAPPHPRKSFEQWYYERHGDPVPEEFDNEERELYTQDQFDHAFANKGLYREE